MTGRGTVAIMFKGANIAYKRMKGRAYVDICEGIKIAYSMDTGACKILLCV